MHQGIPVRVTVNNLDLSSRSQRHEAVETDTEEHLWVNLYRIHFKLCGSVHAMDKSRM